MFTINSEFNLTVSSQIVDFLVFQSSILLPQENCTFDTGYSFDLDAKISVDDIVSLFKIYDNFDLRYYYLNEQGLCNNYDLYENPFSCDKHNNLVCLNGQLISSEYYEVGDDYLRFYVRGDIDPNTSLQRPIIEWNPGDLVTILSPNKLNSLRSYRFSGVGLKLFPTIDLDNKSFSPVKNRTVVFINGKILPIKNYTYGGGSLSLQVETKPTDRINIFVFDDKFEYFEYYPKSGQHIFSEADAYNNRLRYAVKEGACILSIQAPWDEFAGIRNGYYVCAECVIDGEDKLGVARIMDSEFTKSYVSAEIISDFDLIEYDSSQWWMIPGDIKSIVSYLDERTQNTALIPEMLDSYQRIVLNDYYDGIVRVQNSRNIAKMDESFLSRTLNFLGLFLDVTDIGITNRRRALRELSNFYSRIGTQKSTNYLGLIEDSLFTLTDALWTSDYINFYTREELGAKSEKKELVEWTDYRYIGSKPTYFEDYGPFNVKDRFKFEKYGSGYRIPAGSFIMDSSTKSWTIVTHEMNLDPSLYELEAREYYILAVTDSRGSTALTLTESIPTDDTTSLFYYSSQLDKIIMNGSIDVRVSLPLGRYFGQYNWVLPFDVFSYTNDRMFAYKGSAFYYWTNEDNLVTPHSRTLQNTIVNDFSSLQDGEYYIVYRYDDNMNVSIEPRDKNLVNNVGVKLDPSFKRRLTVGTSQYLYDRYCRTLDPEYNEDGSVQKEDNGFDKVKYDSTDLWVPSRTIGSGNQFPTSASKYDVFTKSGIPYAYTGNKIVGELVYDLENKRYNKISDKDDWVRIENELYNLDTNIYPYCLGELYFNLHDFYWYEFNGSTWIRQNVAVVGEFRIQSGEIISVIPYIHNAADWNFREDYPAFVAHTDNQPYKRQYNLERNSVVTATEYNKIFDVAYNWGKISESPNLGWVIYTEFDPPQGFYPTNHVLFNYTANNIEDTQEMLAEARYKFYEICPTPWVLQDIANVLLFESAITWLGSASHGTLDQYFFPLDRYIKVKFIHDSRDKLSIKSNNRMYIFSDHDTCGNKNDVKRIIVNDLIDDVETLLYSKSLEENELERFTINNFRYVEPEITVDDFTEYCICTKFNSELILTLSNGLQTEEFHVTVPNCDEGSDIATINLNSLINPSDLYKVKLNITSENTSSSDQIISILNGVERTQVDAYLYNTDKFEVDIDVRQTGTTGYKQKLFINKSSFVDGEYTVNIHLVKEVYSVRFLSNFGDNFDLYLKEGSTYVLQNSKLLQIPYNTIIEFKYSRPHCNDLIESINIKDSQYISRSLILKNATLSIKVNPSSIKPVIDGLFVNSVNKPLESNILWSAGNYRYEEQNGIEYLLDNKSISLVLNERKEWYSFEDKEDPTRAGKIDTNVPSTAPIIFLENATLAIPSNVTRIRVDVVAAAGYGVYGGKGGRVQCILSVQPDSQIYLHVGKKRTVNNNSVYNASDIRVGGNTLANQVIVAGGGGNSGTGPIYFAGGVGGGEVAGNGPDWYISGGKGGTQVAGGDGANKGIRGYGGLGDMGPYWAVGKDGGAGGDGYYGGGGGYVLTDASHYYITTSGGGGSSYVDYTICDKVNQDVPIHTQGYSADDGYIMIWYLW